ncbi:MAG TPA: hypothetical protein VNW06_03420 [Cytophagaceae bacterium]|nr:hypothetical protein [Cytophagaceae bacterium]
MKKIVSVLTIFLTLLAFSGVLHAQGDKVQFGAYSRTLQQTNRLGKSDTLHSDNISQGSLLVDLGIHVNPDKNTQVSTILRLKSDLGGFYGGGNTATIRQIYVRGIVGKFLNYHVGDLFMKMTPYTMFNNDAELSVNEATVFKNLRNDYVYYDNFNKGNSWWQQGAHTNFAVGFQSKFLQSIKVDGFFLRNRMAVGPQPTRFHAGGRLMLVQSSRFYLGANYLNLYDVGASVGSKATTISVRNPVNTYESEFIAVDNNKYGLQLNAEAGFSQLNFEHDPNAPKNATGSAFTKLNGNFIDGAVTGKLKPAHLKLKVGYSYTSPRFYSSAAQTKRIDYSQTPTTFPIYGNNPLSPVNRNIGAFDIVRDPTIYNQKITPVLMQYNPAYGNATPYGKSTPNRMGFNMELNYKDSLERVNIDFSGAYLTEAVGTDLYNSKRKFLVASVAADVYINKFINFEKKILVHGGARMENTDRKGDSITNVNLHTQLIDAGIEVEVLKKLDLLFGAKILNAKGSENYAIRDAYNEITGYDHTTYRNMNFQQTMLGYGLKYRFSKLSYLTTQYHTYAINDMAHSTKTIKFNQFFIMFIMNF